jgi:hypothetical protein
MATRSTRGLFSVVIDRIYSMVRVKVRNDADTKTMNISASTGNVQVDVASMPAGTGDATAANQVFEIAALNAIKGTDGVKKITDALPAGTNLIGKFGIDQTTPGTTNNVSVTTLKPDGTNTQPSGDAVGRAIFHKLTDGTETASINASNQLEVAEANSAAIKSAVQAIQTAIEILDDWDSSDRCKIEGGNSTDVKVTLDSETVAVSTLKPDGTNTMPSGDDPARAAYNINVNGTTWSLVGSAVAHNATFSQAIMYSAALSATMDTWLKQITIGCTTNFSPAAWLDFELYADGTALAFKAMQLPGDASISWEGGKKIAKNAILQIKNRLGGTNTTALWLWPSLFGIQK